ncbi:uncharacterized protein EI97DRAFT_431502 [Westerdykella ornata]|uniref:Uncharacterized protein n=1 Tax=Westerdykella ornata TaxID=318751 RepID=A0A6A6JPB5_WESOR|nr:uncharacterized protein EI97DRAFT_431502 [Westerdykella ornata]KAF2278237.1 hypothetical protein EI97DRAFT_431502 [Westerdykella ornata]
MPREALENPTQEWYYDFASGYTDQQHDGKVHPLYSDRFVEDSVIVTMHPILSMFFSKVTIFFSTNSSTANSWSVYARGVHAAVTLNILIERMQEEGASIVPKTPSERLADIRFRPLNTKSMAVAWGTRCREKTMYTGTGHTLHYNAEPCECYFGGGSRCFLYDVKTGISPANGEIGYHNEGSWKFGKAGAVSHLWSNARCPWHADLYVTRAGLGELVSHDGE